MAKKMHPLIKAITNGKGYDPEDPEHFYTGQPPTIYEALGVPIPPDEWAELMKDLKQKRTAKWRKRFQK
jgi:hypothetical protein